MSVSRSPVVAVLVLQTAVVDPDTGRLTVQWQKWFSNMSQAVNAGLGLDGTALKMPYPAIGVRGGVQASIPADSQWISQIDASGNPILSQPDFADISGQATAAQIPAGVPFVTFGAGAPASTATEGSIYFDTTGTPYAGYVWHGGAWVAFS